MNFFNIILNQKKILKISKNILKLKIMLKKWKMNIKIKLMKFKGNMKIK